MEFVNQYTSITLYRGDTLENFQSPFVFDFINKSWLMVYATVKNMIDLIINKWSRPTGYNHKIVVISLGVNRKPPPRWINVM